MFIVAVCNLATNYATTCARRASASPTSTCVAGTGFADHNPYSSLRASPAGARAEMREWLRRVPAAMSSLYM